MTIDKRLPTTDFKIFGDNEKKNGVLYLSQRSRIALSPTPQAGNIKAIYYTVNRQEEKRYTGAFKLPQKNGTHHVKYNGIDRLGNKSHHKIPNLYLDLQAPQTTLTLKGPRFQYRKDLYISPRTIIQLQSTDKGSGVQSILYRIDGAPAKSYSNPLTITHAGKHSLRYYAVDAVNNRETQQTKNYIVDRNPPKLTIRYSIEPKKKPGGNVLIFPQNVLIFLEAIDNETELDRVTYSIDNQQKVLYRNPLSNFKPGRVITLKAFAVDRLNNSTQEKISFEIEQWKP
jgi:hypothetical protein